MGVSTAIRSWCKFGAFFAVFAGPSAFAGWGAIAYDYSTGASSEAHGYATYNDAVSTALFTCGPGCVVMSWENNSCIALAAGNGGWGEGHGYATPDDAVDAALNACGTGCAWLEWACN